MVMMKYTNHRQETVFTLEITVITLSISMYIKYKHQILINLKS